MSKKNEEKKASAESPNTESRIAAVRDLIFGENIIQYNSEFAEVNAKIKESNEDNQRKLEEAVATLESNMADLERAMDQRIQDLSTELNKSIEDLFDEKADRRKLGEALEQIALKLQA